jgi:hypothetical protein
MVESIVLVNKSLGTSLPINMATRDYVLENVDWGAIESSNKSYKFINQVGVYVTGTTLESRTISILGWVVADTIEDMKRRKKFLNSFVNPLQRVDLQYNEYRIEGIPETSIKYGSEMPENNEVMCKFLINLFCPDPMFYTQNGSYVSAANWAPKFKFPLIIPSGNYVTYGDTPQGGTLENPVELTGVSQFTVKNQLYQPKLVRPLRRVDQVKDKLQTCFKSVYDKRIVLNGTEDWRIYKDKPNSFRLAMGERVVIGVSNNYALLTVSELGTRTGIYLRYTLDIVITDLACSTVEELKAKLAENPVIAYYQSTAYDGTNGLDVMESTYNVGYIENYAGESITTAWISSTGELSTGAEVAYVLSTPETYATDPLKIGGHGIIMGLRSPSTIATIINTGTLPCGFVITFQASGTVENPKIIDINTQEYIRLSHTMQAGEVIRISTLDNNKTVRQIIGEDSINAFNFLDFANSTFLQLAVGINYLRYDADSGLDNLSVEFKFDPRYLEVQE